MKAKTYVLLSEAVSIGAQLGWNRAHKHQSDPTSDYILECVESAIMGQIVDWFTFEEME